MHTKEPVLQSVKNMDYSLSSIKNLKDCTHTNVVLNKNKSTEFLKSKLESLGFKTKANPDLGEFYFDSFGIDEAKELTKWASFRPITKNPKVAIVSSEDITPEAQNALLKTIEEPYPETYFFFILPRTNTLLETFTSRIFLYSEESGVDDSLAEDFFSFAIKEKFEMIKKYAKNDNGQVLKKIIINLEKNISKDTEIKNLRNMKKIILAKKMALARGSSSKMILEWLSVYI